MVIAQNLQSESIIGHLGRLCQQQGVRETPDRLEDLEVFLSNALMQVESVLQQTQTPEDQAGRSARHLLNLEGKRLRPLCVALAAQTGDGFNEAALNIAIAVELVHSATLLHDDVVDLGTTRRNQPCARLIYGNAASVFGGDWLLVEAMRRVLATRLTGAAEEVLAVIEKMISAEATQLEMRGQANFELERYLKIIGGKTAALFQWAMSAGGRAGGHSPEAFRALEDYGRNLGLAFQIVDDTLDLIGSQELTGKTLFADLREGKMTYPLIIGAERDKRLIALIREFLAKRQTEELPLATQKKVLEILVDTGAVEAAQDFAQTLSQNAIESLSILPATAARFALEEISEASLKRRS